MIAGAFFSIMGFMAVSLVICLIGCCITYIVQDANEAISLFNYWVFNFNGLLVGGTTWGVCSILWQDSKNTYNRILHLIDLPKNDSIVLLKEFGMAHSRYRVTILGIIIGSVGAVTLILSGYPLVGFAKLWLGFWSASLHIFAGFIIVHIYYIIRFFRIIDTQYSSLRLKEDVSPARLDTLNSYFVITATVGILASYFAFRGTLTAGFVFENQVFEKFLVYPIIVYVPFVMLYSFYPRFVLKKIYDRNIMDKLERLNLLQKGISEDSEQSIDKRLQLEETIANLREKLSFEAKRIPIVGIQDTPSLFILLLMFMQFIIHEDSLVNNFFHKFLN